jgi:hypothetical protein
VAHDKPNYAFSVFLGQKDSLDVGQNTTLGNGYSCKIGIQSFGIQSLRIQSLEIELLGIQSLGIQSIGI